MSDIQNDIQIKPEKKKRNKTSKYTEDEKKERAKEAHKKHYKKPDVKVKRNDYYKARYHELDEEAKKKFSQNFLTKYYNMTDEEYQTFLIQCRPYKRKYGQKKTEERKILEEETRILTMAERKKLIKNMSLNAEIQEHYNNLICV